MPLWGNMKRLTQEPIILLHLYPVSMVKAFAGLHEGAQRLHCCLSGFENALK